MGAAAALIALSGCGKKTSVSESRERDSWGFLNWTFTADGVLYRNQNPPRNGKAEYYDALSQSYFPLCGRANCLHKDDTCSAVHLNKAELLGQCGDRWYYLMNEEDGSLAFYSCSMDGSGEKREGDFPHNNYGSVGTRALYTDHSCVYTAEDVDLGTEQPVGEWYPEHWNSGIYQYQFDTKTEQVLVPAEADVHMELIGKYKDKLLYRQSDENSSVMGMLDLGTKEISHPMGKRFLTPVNSFHDGLLAGNLLENDTRSIVEFNLETGEVNEIRTGLEQGARLYWSRDLKLITEAEKSDSGIKYRTYQYGADGKQKLIREDEEGNCLEVMAVNNGMIYGELDLDGETVFKMATISLEDYLAGKSNWTVLEY